MRPKRVLLTRHGKSLGNVNKDAYSNIPDYALPLTPEGTQETLALGDRIRQIIGEERIKFYVSPWRRTRESFMNAVKKLPRAQWTAIEDPRLREQEWGHLRSAAATKILERERDAYGTFHYRFQDGESGADVYDRFSAFPDTAYRDFEKPEFPPNMGIVGHGFTNRMLLCRWLHWSPEQFEEVANPGNAELWVMELQPNGHYQLITPLPRHKVAHQNEAIPPGYREVMPIRPLVFK